MNNKIKRIILNVIFIVFIISGAEKTLPAETYGTDKHYESTNIAEPETLENQQVTDQLEENLFKKNKGPDTIWEQYNEKFLYDTQGADNAHIQKAQETVDKDIEYKLRIELKYRNLKQCLETALENNFNIKISQGIKDNSKWTYRNALSKFLPEFYYEYQIRHVQGEYLVGNVLLDYITETPVQNSFNLGWVNANFVQAFFYSASSKQLYKAAVNGYEFTKDEVILNTAVEYYNLLGKKLNIEVLRINLKEREQQLKMTEGRYKLGVGTKFDILRAEAQVAQAKQQYIEAYNILRLNQAKLANIMGIEILEPVYPFEMNANTINTVSKDLSIDDLYDCALKGRDDIKELEYKIKSLKEQKKALFSDYAPNISFSFVYQKVGLLGQSLHANDTLAFIGQIPLGRNLGIGTYTNIKALDAQIYEYNNRLIKLQREIKEGILNAYYDSLTFKERIAASKKEVEAGDEGLKNALIRWDIGENTFLDVLQAQNTKTTARQELIASIIEYNKAQIRLLFNSGIISVNAVLENYPLREEDNLHNQE